MNDRGNDSLIPWPLLMVLVSLGLALRVVPMFQEFWYDEVVSIRIAFKAPGATNIFFPPTLLDTPLNQIVLRSIGPSVPNWWYRAPSLLEGTAALFLLYLAARRSGRRVSRVTLLLGTFSYMMVHFCSEARGYAAAMFFALAAFLSLEKIREGANAGAAPLFLFWIATALGFLSHPCFILFFAGSLAYSVAESASRPRGSAARWSRLLKIHGPTLVFCGFYLIWLQGQHLAEPLSYDPAKVALDFLDFSFGAPGYTPRSWMVVPLGLVSSVVFLGVAGEWKEGRRERSFFLASSTLAAIVIFVIGNPIAFFPRYLIVLLPFLLLEAAQGVAVLWDRGTAGRLAAVAFLAVFLAGNGYHLYRFLEDGRGHYRDALLEMAAHTEGSTITVVTDHEGRLEPLLWFLVRDIERSTGKKFRLVTEREYIEGANPEWVFMQSYNMGTPFPTIVVNKWRESYPYNLFRLYPHYGLSGFSCAIYRR